MGAKSDSDTSTPITVRNDGPTVPLSAASIVDRGDKDHVRAQRRAPLATLRPGEQGTIVSVGTNGDTGRRLMEMGVVRGEVVRVVKCAPLGDPMELELDGYHLSLRKAEAQTIIVELV